MLAQSDVSSSVTQEALKEATTQEEDTLIQHHSFWVAPQGSYFSLQGNYYNAGMSAGYDYIPFANADEFLSIGFSFSYVYLSYEQQLLKEKANALFGGVSLQYRSFGHEIFSAFYGGNTQSEVKLLNPFLNAQPIKNKNNLSFLFQALYKYNFKLKAQEAYHHSLKPVIGMEVSYYSIPQIEFGILCYEALKGVIPTLDLGIEYQISSLNTLNAFSFLAKYNIQTLKERKALLGTAPIQPPESTQMQEAWLEVAYSGDYQVNHEWSVEYSLLAQLGLKDLNWGVSGNIGVNWRF